MKIFIIFISIFCYFHFVKAIQLIAYISQNGLHGEFYFSEYSNTHIKIGSKLETTLQYPDQIWSWGIHQFPVDYTIPSSSRCSDDKLGEQLVNFDENLGYLQLPGNESSIWESEITLTGKRGIWGKSLLLSNPDVDFRICATILTKDLNVDHIAEARFHSSIAGSIYFRWLTLKMETADQSTTTNNIQPTLIHTDLFHVKKHNASGFSGGSRGGSFQSQHSWKIYTTDILDGENKRHDNCDTLQLIFDPQNVGAGNNSIGDIDSRLGKLKVSTDVNRKRFKQLYLDENLILSANDLTGRHRRLYIVIFDNLHADSVLACAEIRYLEPIFFKSYLNGNGITGELRINQRTKYDPTWLNFTITSSVNQPRENIQYARDVASYYISQLSANPIVANQPDYCNTSGPVYNPLNLNLNEVPPPGYGTQDQYAIGDLNGKLLNRNHNYVHNYYIPGGGSNELNGIYWDVFLPLQGPFSINHRGFLVEKYNRTVPTNVTSQIWTCGTFTLYEKNFKEPTTILTAQVLYRYPIVGRILFRQPIDRPWMDTTIHIEYLIHADGSTQNNSASHRWGVHIDAPGKDFYDWQQRCISTKDIYNPHKVDYLKERAEDYCSSAMKESCRMGDLSSRIETLFIAGNKMAKSLSRRLFSDSNLPLSGHHNILGKSLVIYDDFGPKARGERLACSIISGHFRRKTVARDWYSNGAPLTVNGKLEIVQQSEFDVTDIEVMLTGLDDTSEYQIHMVPVAGDLEFPCEGASLYGHYNPRNFDSKSSPSPGNGTTDQYEMGDLSGKFGKLDGLINYTANFNDLNLPLFGYESILGRSIVIQKRQHRRNWACSTLERGYSASEAREIRGIASFHHPIGYAYGYIRFTQLIHNDGSRSDTVIEVNLRHPGVNDRNLTRNHNWNIFVNSVGVDATVTQTATRCVAGGYIWNPYYTQLADPLNGDLYRTECGPDNPLRCYVGDVSGRLGTIDIGDMRTVFSDPNFPLEGDQSAIGRSIVIFGANKSSERYACANIESDHDIVKYVNLRKPPRFVVAQFLEDVRNTMGLPEWMLSIDSRKTETIHDGGCIQLIMHFKGPIAHQVEIDFARLMDTGHLSSPSLYIPGYIDKKRKGTLSYRQCDVRDGKKNNNNRNRAGKSTANEMQSFSNGFAFFIISITFWTATQEIF